jgi:hypothetical protein
MKTNKFLSAGVSKCLSFGIVLGTWALVNLATLCSANNDYPFKLSNVTATGDVDQLWLDPTQFSVTITNIPGGGRRGALEFIGSGGGSTNGLETITAASALSNYFANVAVGTNGLESISAANILSNTLAQEISGVSTPGLSRVLASGNVASNIPAILVVTNNTGAEVPFQPALTISNTVAGTGEDIGMDNSGRVLFDGQVFFQQPIWLNQGYSDWIEVTGWPAWAIHPDGQYATNGITVHFDTNGGVVQWEFWGRVFDGNSTNLPNQLMNSNAVAAMIVGSGAGATNNVFVPSLGVQFIDDGGTPDTNAIAIDPSIVLTNGANISRLNNDAGYVTQSVTNGLLPSSGTNALLAASGTNGFLTASSTNPLVAQASLPVSPGALASTGYVNSVSNTLAIAITGVSAGTNTPPWSTILKVGNHSLTDIWIDASSSISNESHSVRFIDLLGNTNEFRTVNGAMSVISLNNQTTGAVALVVNNTLTLNTDNFVVNNGAATLSGTTLYVGGTLTAALPAILNSNVWINGGTVVSNSLAVTGPFTAPNLSDNGATLTASGNWNFSGATVIGLGSSITNGLLLISGTNALLAASGTNNLATQASLQAITNGLIASGFSNGQSGTGNISNNNGILYITFPSVTVSGTNSVSSVNTLVSNITITATGNATVTTASSTSGGTITINDPKQFAETNPASASPAPLFWDTKYGALRCSNNFGATFINTPDLSTTSNENTSLTDYFTSTTTSAWIQVNFTNDWMVANSNNWLWLQSNGSIADPAGRYLLKPVPVTNESWRCRILIQPMLGQLGGLTMTEGFGLVSSEGTNGTQHIFAMWRGSSTIAELRAFAPTSPGNVPNGTTESGVDSSTLAQWWGGGGGLEEGPHVPFWMQISYDGSMTQRYTYALSQTGLPPPIVQNGQYTFIKTNQLVNPSYVGIEFYDGSQLKPTYAIKAFVFEQP